MYLSNLGIEDKRSIKLTSIESSILKIIEANPNGISADDLGKSILQSRSSIESMLRQLKIFEFVREQDGLYFKKEGGLQ